MSGSITEVPTTERRTGLRMDPRIARRWVEVRRQQGRRRLRILISIGAALLVLALVAGSLYTPLFRVRHVRVSVRGPMPVATVAALSGLNGHSLMIRVNDSSVARRLDSVPNLGDAQVRTHWPGTVSIHVAVRQAVAAIQGPAAQSPPRWSEIDATGRVIAVVGQPPAGIPLLVGAGAPPPPGQWVDGSAGPDALVPSPGRASLGDLNAESDGPSVPEGMAAALDIAAALPARIAGSIEAIQLGPSAQSAQPAQPGQSTQPGSAGDQATVLSLIVAPTEGSAGPLTVALGDGSQLAAKLTALTALLTQTDLTGLTGLDLTVPDRPAALTGHKSPDSLSTHAGGSH